MTLIYGKANVVNLQATLSSASATAGPDASTVLPHHPITCPSDLRLEPDGTLACQHSTAPSGDGRTQSCLNHSLALLLIELAQSL
jgi:hypothetical protein